LEEARALSNHHAIAYFVQLKLWLLVSNADWFLRSLSLCWAALGAYWLNRWLADEQVSARGRRAVILLCLLNPFFWQYALQIRFYAVFLAASILALWRYRRFRQEASRQNLGWLILSALLLL